MPRSKRSLVSFLYTSSAMSWFHIGLAVTMSNWRRWPEGSVKAGLRMASPRAMSASMS